MLDFTHPAAFHARTREKRELEERPGVPLFERLLRGIPPTEADRLLNPVARAFRTLTGQRLVTQEAPTR